MVLVKASMFVGVTFMLQQSTCYMVQSLTYYAVGSLRIRRALHHGGGLDLLHAPGGCITRRDDIHDLMEERTLVLVVVGHIVDHEELVLVLVSVG